MPVAYDPANFWAVLFDTQESAVCRTWPRALIMLALPVLAEVLSELDMWWDTDINVVLLPFSVLSGLMLSFRINDAYGKWNQASGIILQTHRNTRDTMSLVLAYASQLKPGAPVKEIEARLERMRRLMVLFSLFLFRHVRGHFKKPLKAELEQGLLTEAEYKVLTTTATISIVDQKKDKYPPRNRVAFVIDELHREVAELVAWGALPAPCIPPITASIQRLSACFEDCEHIGFTLVPLPYAQLGRAVMFVYLLLVPLAVVHRLPRGATVALSLVANVIYFSLDAVSSDMETPFGTSDNDVAVEKIVRRIDKHTASQLSTFYGRVVPNYDLFPDTRTTTVDGSHCATAKAHSIYDKVEFRARGLESRISKQQEKRAQRQEKRDQAHAQAAARAVSHGRGVSICRFRSSSQRSSLSTPTAPISLTASVGSTESDTDTKEPSRSPHQLAARDRTQIRKRVPW